MLLFKKNGTDRVIFKVTSCLYTRDLHRLTQKMLNILEDRLPVIHYTSCDMQYCVYIRVSNISWMYTQSDRLYYLFLIYLTMRLRDNNLWYLNTKWHKRVHLHIYLCYKIILFIFVPHREIYDVLSTHFLTINLFLDIM